MNRAVAKQALAALIDAAGPTPDADLIARAIEALMAELAKPARLCEACGKELDATNDLPV
jgi:hypothetical protein